MTDPAKSTSFYPPFCFQESPTFHKWCFLRASDISALRIRLRFEGWFDETVSVSGLKPEANNMCHRKGYLFLQEPAYPMGTRCWYRRCH
jgi:hypothetical protein